MPAAIFYGSTQQLYRTPVTLPKKSIVSLLLIAALICVAKMFNSINP